MAKTPKSKSTIHEFEGSPNPALSVRSSSRTKKILLGLVILLTLVWIAPWALVKSPARNMVANALLGDFRGDISIGSASTGWLSPIRLNNVSIKDEHGVSLAQIERIDTDRALLAIITHPNRPGHVSVEGGSVRLALDDGVFGWEVALQELLNAPKSGEPLEDFSVSIANLDLHLQQAASPFNAEAIQHQVRIVEAELILAGAGSGIRSTATLKNLTTEAETDATVGQTVIELTSSRKNDHDLYEAKLDASNFDLDWASIMAARFAPGSKLSGELNGSVQLSQPTDSEYQFNFVETQIAEFKFTYPPLMKDRLSLDAVSVEGGLAWNGSSVEATSFSATCDVGEISIDGHLDPKLVASSTVDLENLKDFSLDGSVDIRKLAAKLPQTMHLREGIEIDDGELKLVAFSRVEGGARRLFADINVTGIAGRNQEQTFSIDRPIEASLSALASDGRLVLDFFECNSDFFNCEGSGDLVRGQIEGSADLGQLQQELGQFIDLESLALAGTLTWKSEWQPVDPTTFEPIPENSLTVSTAPATSDLRVDLELHLVDASIQVGESAPFTEPHVQMLSAVILNRNEGALTVTAGTAEVRSDSDVLAAQLLEPSPVDWKTSVPVQISIDGQAKTLIRHMNPYVPEWVADTRGTVSFRGTGHLSQTRLSLQDATYALEQFNLSSGGFEISEPRLEGTLQVDADLATSTLTVSQTSIQGSTISASLDRLKQTWGEQGVTTTLEVVFRTDAYRVGEWFPAMRNQNVRPFGEFMGNVTLQVGSTGMSIDLNGQANQFAMGQRVVNPEDGTEQWQGLWAEPQITYTAKLRHDLEHDRFDLESVAITSPAIAIEGSGHVARPWDECDIDIQGNLRSDLGLLSERLAGFTQDMVHLEGQSSELFTIQGKLGSEDGVTASLNGQPVQARPAGLVPASLFAEAGFGFDRANIMGLDTQSGRIQTSLQQQVLRFEPISIQIGLGKFAATPAIRLDGSAPVLELRNEQILQNVTLTPEVTRSWIRYAAPIVAGTTETQGTFSAYIERASIPLTNVFSGTAAGSLQVQQASLTPGPVVSQLIGIISQLRAVLKGQSLGNGGSAQFAVMPEQTIRFQMQDGRIHHDQVSLLIDDVMITTSGSIGADQSLDMVVAFRIPEDWVGGRRFTGALANLEVKIPLRGTLSRPVLDQKAIQDITSGLLKNAAGGLLEDELRRGLQGLFGPSGGGG